MNWINKLFSDSPDVSSKRLITVITLLLLVACYVILFCGTAIPVEYLWLLATLCAGSAGLTIVDKKL